MRLLCLMLLLSSLVLPEDEPPLQAGAGGEEAGAGPPLAVPEGPWRLQLCEAAFCWQCTFLWMAETPWGFHLAGAAALLLWLGVNVWSMSCLATPPKEAPSRAAASLEADGQQETVFPPQRDRTLRRLTRIVCACGTQTTDFESYEPPSSYGPSSVPPSELGSWNCPEVVFHPNDGRTDLRTWPPAPSNVPSQRTPSSSCSSSYSSSSSSSSSSSFCSSLCLVHLKPLDLRPALESPASDSSETVSDTPPASPSASEPVPSASPGRVGPAPCPDAGDASGAQEKAESTALEVLQYTQRHLGAEMLPALLAEGAGPHPLASYAQINILQGYKKEDQIVFVAKSLAIRLGRGPAEGAQSSLPPQAPPPVQEEEEEEEEEEVVRTEEEEEAPELSFMRDKSLHLIDDNVRRKNLEADALRSLQEDVRRSIVRAASRAGAEADLPPPPGAPDGLGEDARRLLERHVQRKMIQRRFGVPSVVMASLRVFQALTRPGPGERSAGSGHAQRLEQSLVLMDTGQSRLLVSPSSVPAAPSAQPLRKPPGRIGPSASDSVAPGEVPPLSFHSAVKRLEVQLAAFPALVGKSLRLFEALSAERLPKPALLGNRTERLQPPSLPFLAQEALSIIDLNVSRKSLLSTRALSAQDLEEAVRVARQEPRDREGDSAQRTPGLATGPPWGAEPGPALGELPGASSSSLEGPTTPPSPAEPEGPKDHTTEGGSVSPSQPCPEAPDLVWGEAPRPPPRALALVHKSHGHSCPLSPLAKCTSPGPFPSVLVLKLAPRPPSPRGPGEDASIGAPQDLDLSQPVQFHEATIPGLALDFCSWVTPRTPCPSLSSMVTASASSSSEARGPEEEEATKEASQKPGAPRQVQFHEVTIPGLALDVCSWVTPRAPCPSLSSIVETTTSSSSEERGPEEEGANKEASQNLDISQQLQAATIPGEEGPLSAPGSQGSSPSATPRSSGQSDGETAKDGSKLPGASPEGRFQQATVSQPGPSVKRPPPVPQPLKPSHSLLVAATGLRPLSSTLFTTPPVTPSSSGGSEEDAAKRHPRVSQEAPLHKATFPEPPCPQDHAARPGVGQRVEGGAGADGKGTLPEPRAEGDGDGREESRIWQEEEESPVTRTSIFLELELKKEKLNLHLKKRLGAPLLPQQRAALELSVDVDRPPSSRRARRAAPQQPPGPEAQGKPSRPFCYVCMPLDDTGSVVKTVCWDLPRWILDLNGHRVPQVARFEKRPKRPQAGRRRKPPSSCGYFPDSGTS